MFWPLVCCCMLNTHHHHEQAPSWSVAVSTRCFQCSRSWVYFQAELRPRLRRWRSATGCVAMTRTTGWASPILGHPSDGDFECSGDVKWRIHPQYLSADKQHNIAEWSVSAKPHKASKPASLLNSNRIEEESPADAVKPARRKSMQKLLQFDVFRFISPNSISPNFKV